MDCFFAHRSCAHRKPMWTTEVSLGLNYRCVSRMLAAAYFQYSNVIVNWFAAGPLNGWKKELEPFTGCPAAGRQ